MVIRTEHTRHAPSPYVRRTAPSRADTIADLDALFVASIRAYLSSRNDGDGGSALAAIDRRNRAIDGAPEFLRGDAVASAVRSIRGAGIALRLIANPRPDAALRLLTEGK